MLWLQLLDMQVDDSKNVRRLFIGQVIIHIKSETYIEDFYLIEYQNSQKAKTYFTNVKGLPSFDKNKSLVYIVLLYLDSEL